MSYLPSIVLVVVLIIASWQIVSFVKSWKHGVRGWKPLSKVLAQLALLSLLLLMIETPVSYHSAKRTIPTIVLSGRLDLPSQVYEASAIPISLTLTPSLRGEGGSEDFKIQERSNSASILMGFRVYDPGDTLQVQLIAPGVTLGEESSQQQPLTTDRISYRWTGFLKDSGSYLFRFVYKVGNQSRAGE
jgi:hypothetical protein